MKTINIEQNFLLTALLLNEMAFSLTACSRKGDGEPVGEGRKAFVACKLNCKSYTFNFITYGNSKATDWNKAHFEVLREQTTGKSKTVIQSRHK